MSWLIDAVHYVNLEDLHEIFTKTTTWDLATRDADGQTCVDYLIYLDDDECCAVMEVMFQHGVAPDQLLYSKFHVIHYFVTIGKENQVDILLKYGASPNFINDNITLIGMAVHKEHHTLLQLLFDQGGNPNIKDADGDTPLHIAVPRRYKSAQILLQKGADHNISNNDGKTAKMIATQSNIQEIIELLDSYEIDIKEPVSTAY